MTHGETVDTGVELREGTLDGLDAQTYAARMPLRRDSEESNAASRSSGWTYVHAHREKSSPCWSNAVMRRTHGSGTGW